MTKERQINFGADNLEEKRQKKKIFLRGCGGGGMLRTLKFQATKTQDWVHKPGRWSRLSSFFYTFLATVFVIHINDGTFVRGEKNSLMILQKYKLRQLMGWCRLCWKFKNLFKTRHFYIFSAVILTLKTCNIWHKS